MTSSNKDLPHIINQIKISKIIAPIIIGLAVVAWLMYIQLDLKELQHISHRYSTYFFIGMAIAMYVCRHIFYAWRLRIMTDNAFGWLKAIQLIFIWEFSSAVSPTSVGGAGVAIFLLSQEKIGGAKTITVVLYSMVIDTAFFVVLLPILYLGLGPIIIRPDMVSLSDLDGFGFTFITVLFIMILYGSIFFYGLFINPKAIKSLLISLSRIKILAKFRQDLLTTSEEVITTSTELKKKSRKFHFLSVLSTTGAWSTRFLAINFLILAIVHEKVIVGLDHIIIWSRSITMHVITSFSPTPGAAGIAEYLFGGFFSDYIPLGIASLIALVWRLITYYPYLIAGAIIIPYWLKRIRSYNKYHPKM